MPSSSSLQACAWKTGAIAAVIVAVMQRRLHAREQSGKPRLALDQRQRGDVIAVEMQKVEDEIHQPGRVAGVGRGLDVNDVMPSGKTPHNSPSR